MDTEKPGRLLKGFRAQAGHLIQGSPAAEGAVPVTAFDNIPGRCRPEAGDICKEFLAGGIQLHTDLIDTAHHRIIQTLFQPALIHIVLVLSHADGLGIDFDQLGKRIHEPPPDGDGAADRDILVREFLSRGFRCGIDRGAAFVYHDNRDGFGQFELAHKGFRLPAGGAVSDGDGLDPAFFDQRRYDLFRFFEHFLRLADINGRIV